MSRHTIHPTTPPAEERPYPVGMWDDERAHPWRALGLIFAAIAFGMIGAHGQASGWW